MSSDPFALVTTRTCPVEAAVDLTTRERAVVLAPSADDDCADAVTPELLGRVGVAAAAIGAATIAPVPLPTTIAPGVVEGVFVELVEVGVP